MKLSLFELRVKYLIMAVKQLPKESPAIFQAFFATALVENITAMVFHVSQMI